MKIDMFYQVPNGTVLVISGEHPKERIGNYLKIDNLAYKIKGVSTLDTQTILIEKAQNIEKGQEVEFLKSIT